MTTKSCLINHTHSRTSSVAGAGTLGDELVGPGDLVQAHRGHEILTLNYSVEVVHYLFLGDLEATILMSGLVLGLIVLVGYWGGAVILLELLNAVLLSGNNLPLGDTGLIGFQTWRVVVRWCNHAVCDGLIDETKTLFLELGGTRRFLFKLLVVLSG